MRKLAVSIACFVVSLVPLAPVFAAPQQNTVSSAKASAGTKANPGNSQTPSTAKRPLTANEKKWLALEPLVMKYRKVRVDASNELATTLIRTLLQLDSEIDGRKFAQEIMGIQNIHQVLGNDLQIRAFVQRSFEKHVININDIEQALAQFLKEHDTKMAEIDNQFLIECQLDVEFDPASIRQSRVQLDNVRQELLRLSANLNSTITQAFTHHLIAGGAGLIGGEAGNMIGNELGRDSNGNGTWEGQAMGLFFGIVTAIIAEEIASSAMGTEKEVAAQAAAAGHNIIRNHLLLREGFAPVWLKAFDENLLLHHQICVNSLHHVLGPHPNSEVKSNKK